MTDILEAFQGTFKQQEGINSNWLPLPKDKVNYQIRKRNFFINKCVL